MPADHDTLIAMLTALASSAHAATRFGRYPDSDRNFRWVLADALSDHGRDEEAALARDCERHVTVADGRVVPARYTVGAVYGAISEFFEAADDAGFSDMEGLHFGPPDVVPADAPDDGQPLPPGHVRTWDNFGDGPGDVRAWRLPAELAAWYASEVEPGVAVEELAAMAAVVVESPIPAAES